MHQMNLTPKAPLHFVARGLARPRIPSLCLRRGDKGARFVFHVWNFLICSIVLMVNTNSVGGFMRRVKFTFIGLLTLAVTLIVVTGTLALNVQPTCGCVPPMQQSPVGGVYIKSHRVSVTIDNQVAVTQNRAGVCQRERTSCRRDIPVPAAGWRCCIQPDHVHQRRADPGADTGRQTGAANLYRDRAPDARPRPAAICRAQRDSGQCVSHPAERTAQDRDHLQPDR